MKNCGEGIALQAGKEPTGDPRTEEIGRYFGREEQICGKLAFLSGGHEQDLAPRVPN